MFVEYHCDNGASVVYGTFGNDLRLLNLVMEIQRVKGFCYVMILTLLLINGFID